MPDLKRKILISNLVVISYPFKQHVVNRRERSEKLLYRSRNQRNIKRQIRFAEVDANAIDASYEQGVLQITLPTKVEET